MGISSDTPQIKQCAKKRWDFCTADVRVYRATVFTDLVCKASICKHSDIIKELKQIYYDIRSKRPKESF